MFVSRRSAVVFSKGTWFFGVALAVIALVVNLFFLPGRTTAEQRSVIQEGGRTNVPTAPTLPPQNQTPSGK